MNSQDIRNLQEAYMEVYAPQELIEEQVWGEVESWVNSLVEEGYDLSEYTWDEMAEIYEDKYKPKTKAQLRRYVVALDKLHNIATGKPQPQEEPKPKPNPKRRTQLGNVEIREDIYDVILSHLIEEGYAESVEQAEVIMVNMSEDWRESIVEGATGAFVPSRMDDFNNRRDMLKNRYGQDVSPRIPGPSGGGQFEKPSSNPSGALRLAKKPDNTKTA